MQRIAVVIASQKHLDLVNKCFKNLETNPTVVWSAPVDGLTNKDYLDLILLEEGEDWPLDVLPSALDKFGGGPIIYCKPRDIYEPIPKTVPIVFVGTKQQVEDFRFSLWQKVIIVDYPWAVVTLLEENHNKVKCVNCDVDFIKPKSFLVSVRDLPVMIRQCPNCSRLNY
jgi:hypothetical protein